MWIRILAAAALLGAAPPDAGELSWMAGCWEQRDGDRWTEECWTTMRGGLMLGSGRTGRGGSILEWESLRIERDAPNGEGPIVRLAYFAAPGGRGWTRFAGASNKGPGVTFYNFANDYPQRIRYWRDGDSLMAEIAMKDGSRPRRWRYRRTGARALKGMPTMKAASERMGGLPSYWSVAKSCATTIPAGSSIWMCWR
ncbi:MAG TPA: DUF6265 family protein [Allosphingosinicella sp.]|nr:DUF6265 family protein [Allosphingosinicella sp.]